MTRITITLFILFLKICLFFPTISALNQEGLSLLAWLSTFDSSSSATFFSSWNSTDRNPCGWDFIKCNNQEFVSEITITSIYLPTRFPNEVLSFDFLEILVLSNGNLTGEIPSSVGNSSSLVTLDLSYNNLTGTIPPEIGKLSALQSLSCMTTKFLGISPRRSGGGNLGIDGEIPAQLSNCKKLQFLGLADTGITGEIPRSFGELKNLVTLSVYTGNLSGEIPPELGNCSSLEDLFLYQNGISGEIPEEIGFLKNLKRLLLWQNNLRGTIPGSLGNCSSLTVIDFSMNFLSGEIPQSLRSVGLLEGLLLSDNHISGVIPQYIGNFSNLRQLELDNNYISGEIPSNIGLLKELSLFFAWKNQLRGNIPDELANCKKLEDLDLSNNYLTGSVPKSLFNLRNLTKLLLISNRLSGRIPAEIGNCTSLIRLRLGSNRLDGEIPSEIRTLESLRFLELSENQLTGEIPSDIGNCKQLEMVDLHGNKLTGTIPLSFVSLLGLNVLDLSINEISGDIPQSIGNLTSLNKLVLSGNNISGPIPQSLGLCKDLQLLDISNNRLSGSIPDEIGRLEELDILLNLSSNYLTGEIPKSFSNFSNLANMDISHNMFVGSLQVLGNLDNLVSLNVSYNDFSGTIPNTNEGTNKRTSARNLTIFVLLTVVAFIMVTAGVILYKRARDTTFEKNDEEGGINWDFTPYQKLNFSVEDVVIKLSDSNIVGRGGSGIVYRVETPMGQVVAVKRLWPKNRGEIPQRDLFSAEVTTLGSIRHKNIVKLLGCCDNGETRLLLFDYISNGSLAGLLHEKKIFLDWDTRYNIVMGAAQGLAYLHHDCVPPIVHRDIKTNNILVGPLFEAFLADFGLAKLVSSSDTSRASDIVAGSYGYIAPEYGYSLKITEKSDVYSYGIVLLEVLTGMEPTDPTIPDGKNLVSWVYEELRTEHRDFTSIVDQQLLLQSGTQTEEMLQVLGIALLCVSPCPDERPTMRDVIAMLDGIKHENEEFEKPRKEASSNQRPPVQCRSFTRLSKPLIRSPPHSQ
ncbi:hypothetical protein MIMGU_mgv1a000670mg [Erythranthe guttata]|uniref:Protein kinase domain-containing protein n=1 Tax=Erythranthe guttata TaxID=4155 RepID=A0A022PPV3_ERYGU|nr:hypothetical protein MIMGU_mgv1a000670mg [Erythranthe guttata]